MKLYQRDFLTFALDMGVLRFGEFTLKSGRVSPYFFNAGLFNTGESLAKLGRYYAWAIVNSGIEFDVLYGPAYKGIPLASVTAAALWDVHGISVPYAFNRKEAKDHGEGGGIVGHPLEGKILTIDDVITAGTAIRESVEIIEAQGAVPAGAVVSLDREEKGKGELSAIQEIEESGLSATAIITFSDLLYSCKSDTRLVEQVPRMEQYRDKYGV